MVISIIVGLGNPGEEYRDTRHNAGFWFLDGLASNWSLDKKFNAKIAEVNIASERVLLLKPQTFMNRSGFSVQACCGFYKIKSTSMLVVHDDLDLAPGVVRLKYSGGHGGHNGLRDIMSALGTNDFFRLRVGVGRPQDKSQVSSYVLKSPPKSEALEIQNCLADLESVLPMIVQGQAEKVMNQLNKKVIS